MKVIFYAYYLPSILAMIQRFFHTSILVVSLKHKLFRAAETYKQTIATRVSVSFYFKEG